MRRLSIVIGVLGAIVGGFQAYKLLRNVPSERYQHKIYEELTTEQIVKREQALLLAARKDGIVFWHPLTSYVGDPHAKKLDVVGQDDSAQEVAYETLEKRYVEMISPELRQPTASNEIRVIFWKPDLTVDFFDMQGGGYVSSEPSPSAWLYLLWID